MSEWLFGFLFPFKSNDKDIVGTISAGAFSCLWDEGEGSSNVLFGTGSLKCSFTSQLKVGFQDGNFTLDKVEYDAKGTVYFDQHTSVTYGEVTTTQRDDPAAAFVVLMKAPVKEGGKTDRQVCGFVIGTPMEETEDTGEFWILAGVGYCNAPKTATHAWFGLDCVSVTVAGSKKYKSWAEDVVKQRGKDVYVKSVIDRVHPSGDEWQGAYGVRVGNVSLLGFTDYGQVGYETFEDHKTGDNIFVFCAAINRWGVKNIPWPVAEDRPTHDPENTYLVFGWITKPDDVEEMMAVAL